MACSTLLATMHRVKEEKKLILFFIDNSDNGDGKKQVVQHGVERATMINNNDSQRLLCATLRRYTIALVKLRSGSESRTPAMRFPPRGGSWLAR